MLSEFEFQVREDALNFISEKYRVNRKLLELYMWGFYADAFLPEIYEEYWASKI